MRQRERKRDGTETMRLKKATKEWKDSKATVTHNGQQQEKCDKYKSEKIKLKKKHSRNKESTNGKKANQIIFYELHI